MQRLLDFQAAHEGNGVLQVVLFLAADPQFIVADELVRVCGTVAWVACTENLLADDGFGGTVAALNVFEQQDERWVIVAHHGSPVARKV